MRWAFIPNTVTLLRGAAAVAFIFLLLSGEHNVLALAVFVLASISDWFDGWFARRFQCESEFGKLWDPIFDKALTLGALLVFALRGLIPLWAVALIIVREAGLTILRFHIVRKGGKVIPAGFPGKAKTTLQMAFIIFVLAGAPFDAMRFILYKILFYGLFWVMFFFTFYSAYFILIDVRKRLMDARKDLRDNRSKGCGCLR